MGSLYNKNYIYSFKEKDINPIFTGEIYYIPNPHNMEERNKYIATQHYLIKYLEGHGKTPIINKLLNIYIDDFLKYPHLFVDSPLIKDDFINKYLPKDIRLKIQNFRRMYFDHKQNEEIYLKLMRKEDLSETQKNRLYSYLIHQMKIGNELLEKHYEECAKRILSTNKPISELNNQELKFYCTYISKIAGKDFKIFPDVHIVKINPKTSGIETHNIIYINKFTSFTPTLHEITQVVCHETRHAIQEKEAKTSRSRLAFDMASHMLFNKYLNTKTYNTYKVNYRYSDIELDAERSGFFNAAIILANLGRPDLAYIVCEKEKTRLKKRNYYECMINQDNKRTSSDHFILENLNKIIKKHPEEIRKFKVLEDFYKPNGTPKPFINMLTEKMNKSFANRGTFDSFINDGIAKNELKKINLKKLSKEEKLKVFKSLSQIYISRTDTLKSYLYDSEYKRNDPNQIKITTLYQIKLLDNIISYIDENIDIVLSLKEDDKIDKKSFIYGFISGFREFNLKYAHNDVLKNDKLINDRINKLTTKCKSVINKYDRQYILDRIIDMTEEELNTTITTPNGHKMTFKEYLFYDLLPRMNGSSTINMDGVDSKIKDIIKFYKKEIRKKNSNGNNQK